MWKVVLKAFEVVGNGLAWRVGYGNLIRIGLDPWVGSYRENILTADLCSKLDQGFLPGTGQGPFCHKYLEPWLEKWENVGITGGRLITLGQVYPCS
jgi:hypothetical protein